MSDGGVVRWRGSTCGNGLCGKVRSWILTMFGGKVAEAAWRRGELSGGGLEGWMWYVVSAKTRRYLLLAIGRSRGVAAG